LTHTVECTVKARSSDGLLDCEQQFGSYMTRRVDVRLTGRSTQPDSVDVLTVLSEL